MLCCPDGPRGSHFRKVIPSPGGGLRGDINGVLPLRDGRSLSPLLFLALPKCSFTVSIPDERLEGVTVSVVEPPGVTPRWRAWLRRRLQIPKSVRDAYCSVCF